MVYIMSRCNQCNIKVIDDTEVCPLCGTVLTGKERGVSRYPDVRQKVRSMRILLNVYIFLAIAVEVLLIWLNYRNFHGVYWSAVTFVVFLYGYFALHIFVIDKMSYSAKTTVQVLGMIIFVILLDVANGYRGWSVNYVLPSGIILLDLIIVIFMCINRRSWQSFILLEMFTTLCSLIPLLLVLLDVITKPTVSEIAFIVSLLLFVGTIIIGDRKARVELRRRFHVK